MIKAIFSIIIIMGFVASMVYAQEQEQEKTLTRKEKKEIKLQKALEEKMKVIELLETKKWIVEIDLIINQNAESEQTNHLKNYLGMNGDIGLFNLESITHRIYEGMITDFEIIEGKERTQPLVKYHFQGRGYGSSIRADIQIVVNNEKRATITMLYDVGERKTLQGRLVPWDQSKVYKENY